MRVAICICTFRRPELLRDLLHRIAGLTFGRVEKPRIQIVVVDNDELATAREICDAVSLPWPMHYVVEPKPGITHARNRAIAEAEDTDFIAFIDDDEVPTARWLDELLGTQREFAGDVVSGPVFPKYTPEIPEWVRNGGFFEPRTFPTGTTRNTCACNNALVATHVLKRVPTFDHDFALSGAEDTDFFLRVRKAGHKIVWSQEAVVFEIVSMSRGSVFWILRREYQTGNGWVFCEASVDGRLSNPAARFAKACGHVVIGSAKAVQGFLLFNKIAAVRALQRVTLGTGMLVALAGHRFLAYQPKRQPLETDERIVLTSSSKATNL
ncbi:MAG: glycosyltransferase [Candidatus Sulfotelmatobacter sp.]